MSEKRAWFLVNKDRTDSVETRFGLFKTILVFQKFENDKKWEYMEGRISQLNKGFSRVRKFILV